MWVPHAGFTGPQICQVATGYDGSFVHFPKIKNGTLFCNLLDSQKEDSLQVDVDGKCAAQITEVQLAIKAHESEIETKNSEIDAKDCEIKAKKGEIIAYKKEIDAKNCEIRAKDDEIAAKQDQSTAKDSEIMAKDGQIKAKQSEIAAKEDMMRAKEYDIRRMTKLTADLELQVDKGE